MPKKILILLIMAFLVIPFSRGIGVGLYTQQIDFKPNLNENFNGIVSNNVGTDIRVELKKKGELAEYVTFAQEYIDIPKGQTTTFTFNIKLPEKLNPGINTVSIGAEDVTPSTQGGISAKTAAFWPFTIRVPYPGKYIEASFSANDIEENKIATFNINIISRGDEIINKIDGMVEIFEQNNRIALLTLNPITNIQPKESRAIQAEWDSRGHTIGEYNAKATINYDSEQITLGATFKIGALLVKITNYTKEFYKDEINQFDIEIQSFWNINIEDVYAEIMVGKEKIKTTKIVLAPWSKTTITAYLDTHNLDLGEHTANIKVYYADKVAEEIAKIIILPKRERVVEKIVELPSKIPPTTVLLIAIIILLIIGNIGLVLLFIKTKKPEKPKKKEIEKDEIK